ncbi:hypothetical protein OKW28_000192 [Paraburkholderia sp. 40]
MGQLGLKAVAQRLDVEVALRLGKHPGKTS